jgi:hypothetical protein
MQRIERDEEPPEEGFYYKYASDSNMTYKSLTCRLRYVYSPHSRWGMAGDIYPCWNSDGSKKWPWLSREIHDWESPNGVVIKYREYGLGAFPDEQPHFLDDMMIESKEDKEEEEYVENEEVEAEADVFAEMEMEDKVKGVKEGKRKKGMRRTRAKKEEGDVKGKGKAKKGKM